METQDLFEGYRHEFPQSVAVGTRFTRKHEHKLQPWLNTAWDGVVLALNDVRAWTGTIRFPGKTPPTQNEVDNHVAWCRSEFPDDHDVPVLYAYPEGPTVQWESPYNIQYYLEQATT